MTHAKQIEDTLDCGSPEETWDAMITHLRIRANTARSISQSLRKDAEDALDQADGHLVAAKEFDTLADALTRAPVTFPKIAKATETGTAETENTGSVEDEGAVGKADLPKGS